MYGLPVVHNKLSMHKKTNYQPWSVEYDDFFLLKSRSDELKFLIKLASLAPSPFNTQPWRFEISDTKIILSPDFNRALHVADPLFKDLFLSLGCALENIVVAAEYYDLAPEVEIVGEGKDMQIVVGIRKSTVPGSTKTNHPAESILKRNTNRGKYDPTIPDRDFLGEISRIGSSLGISVNLIGDYETKEKIAELLTKTEADMMAKPSFRKEIAQYVRSNTTKKYTGITGAAIGLPTIVSLATPFFAPFVNFKKLRQKEDKKLLVYHTPVLGLITAQEDNEKNWIQGGRIYERIALIGGRNSIHIAPYSVSMYRQSEKNALQRLFKTSSVPLLVFRLGYGKELAHHTPRFPLEKILSS